jgi:hypothetical protein
VVHARSANFKGKRTSMIDGRELCRIAEIFNFRRLFPFLSKKKLGFPLLDYRNLGTTL